MLLADYVNNATLGYKSKYITILYLDVMLNSPKKEILHNRGENILLINTCQLDMYLSYCENFSVCTSLEAR